MKHRKYLFLFILFTVNIFNSSTAYSNGINPPRPRYSSPGIATCIDRSNLRHEIFRVKIMDDGVVKNTIAFHFNNIIEDIAINDIKLIIINSDKVDDQSFAKVNFLRTNSEVIESARVQIRNVVLTGFMSNGTGGKIDIFLSYCKTLDFYFPTSGDIGNTRPVIKK